MKTIKITINDNRKIFTIQEAFSNSFPYLKLEFHAKSNTAKGAAANKFVDHSKHVADCRTQHNNGQLIITPGMKVNELEEAFRIFGISTLVFRKSGKAWLETTATGNWTLADQNREGEILSKNEPDENHREA